MVGRWQKTDVPARLHDRLQANLHGELTGFTSATAGFSPALAGMAELPGERRVFLKGIPRQRHPGLAASLDREIAINLAIATHDPPAPRFVGHWTEDGWTVGAWDAVAGEISRHALDRAAASRGGGHPAPAAWATPDGSPPGGTGVRRLVRRLGPPRSSRARSRPSDTGGSGRVVVATTPACPRRASASIPAFINGSTPPAPPSAPYACPAAPPSPAPWSPADD